MRAYVCWFAGEEWICVVVAPTAREAKRIFWRENPFGPRNFEVAEWIDVQAKWLRSVILGCEPKLFDFCTQAAWMCSAWDWDAWSCKGCSGEKAKEEEEEVKTP